jgi:plastocyanin
VRGLLFTAALAACVAASGLAWREAEAAIGIDNFTLSPAKLTVAKGTEVTWTNRDDIPHSIVLGAIGVRSKAMDTDGSFVYRFDRAGTFGYICGLHPRMRGQVVVR